MGKRIRNLCEKIGEKYLAKGLRRTIVGDDYMHRHYLLFKGQEFDNKEDESGKVYPFNAFLHHIMGSDEPVYHDHPWMYITFILAGGYWEHTPIFDEEGYIIGDTKKWYGAGSFRIAKPNHMHWLEMGEETTWTLFLRFRRKNEWGFQPFMHKEKIHWKKWVNGEGKRLGFKR
jgi:hypothetical protein